MKILHLVASPRGINSFSKKLGNEIIQRLQSANPNSKTTVRDLAADPFPHLEEVHINGFFTPEEKRTPELVEAVKHSNEAITELKDADTIVVDIPMYNFGIPSTLKTWIDHICRVGQTFSYSEKGPEGLVKGKKVYLAISTGGIYTDGPMKPFDFTEVYIRSVFGFLGMTDVTSFRVEGLNAPDMKEQAWENAIQKLAV